LRSRGAIQGGREAVAANPADAAVPDRKAGRKPSHRIYEAGQIAGESSEIRSYDGRIQERTDELKNSPHRYVVGSRRRFGLRLLHGLQPDIHRGGDVFLSGLLGSCLCGGVQGWLYGPASSVGRQQSEGYLENKMKASHQMDQTPDMPTLRATY
jgi:hypothetical protein